MATLPDAVGLISWNEFSENTHVEPSQRDGHAYLDLLASLAELPPLSLPDFDSSAPEGSTGGWTTRVLALLSVVAAAAAGLLATYRRTHARSQGHGAARAPSAEAPP
jgi:hypothetical protein